MYQVSVAEDLKVKASYLRHYLFVTRFNIRFKSLSTDVCSTWLQLSEKIKVANPQEVVNNLRTDLSIHKTLASGFFDVMKKAEDNVVIISYDMQKICLYQNFLIRAHTILGSYIVITWPWFLLVRMELVLYTLRDCFH